MRIAIESNLWESDFLLNDILPKGEINYIQKQNIQFYDLESDVFIFPARSHTYNQILSVIKKVKPKVIICLSDELIWEDLSEFNQLGNYCDLFLRQYHHPNYTYTPNTIHIPLGYTNDCKVFSEDKKLTWSFFGEMKNDRKHMISEFSKLGNHFVAKSVAKDLMCKVYSKSIFVPCGRGNCSLDCFRLYEASMNGSIPVVVGSEEEIYHTFKYENNPPWIFAETWEEARETCENLLKDQDKLNDLKNDVVSWWQNRIQIIQNRVKEVL